MHVGGASDGDCGQSESRWPAELAVEEVDDSLLQSFLVDLLPTAEVFVQVVPFLVHGSVACREDFAILGGEDYFFDEAGGEAQESLSIGEL